MKLSIDGFIWSKVVNFKTGKLEQASLVTPPAPEFSIASEFVEDARDVKAEEWLSKNLAQVQDTCIPT